MGTEPIKEFLPNFWGTESDLEKLLKEFSELIIECVNFGTHVHEWIHKSFKGEKDYPLPVLFLLRHTLEIGLSLSALVEKSLIDPAKIQARSLFESQLYIKYLVENDFKKRSYAFLVTHYIDRQNLHQMLNPNTILGKQFESEMKGTQLEDIAIHEDYDLEKASENLDELFKKEGFNEAYDEYFRVKKKYNKSHKGMSFYNLYEEILSIKSLSEHLGMIESYQINYRYWSDKVHASDVLTGYLDSDDAGNRYFIALKDPSHAQTVTFYCVHYLIHIFSLLIKEFRNDKMINFQLWYLDSIKNKYHDLGKRKIINIDRK